MTMRVARLAVAFLGLSLAAGCSSVKETHGFVLDEALIKSVQVGTDNKDSVAKSLGRPTFTGQFSDNDWYYISQKTSQFAFTRPKIKDETVLHVRFDPAGNVAAVETTDETKIAAVSPMGGKTPTLGHKKSLLSEIFGNISSVAQTGLPGTNQQ